MNEDIRDQAWQWHCALQRSDADWDGFTAWLEADPAHRTAYDEAALLDDALDRQRDRLKIILPAEGRDAPPRPRRRLWLLAGGALAAALALFIAMPSVWYGASGSTDYQTAAGQMREIALTDGSHITLGPSSHLAISGDRQERMELKGGAWFDIRHDPDRQLVVTAGEQKISDIGTQFDVLALGNQLRVAVAEGQVSVRTGGGQPVIIPAGRRIAIDSSANSARVENIITRDVGGWRSGRLVYTDAPLSLVAADISRYVGHEVVVSPDIANRRFSGVLAAGNGADLVGELGDLMGLEPQSQGDTVRLVAGGR